MKLYPPGWISCANAIEQVGRSMCGEAWTGAERSARPGLISAEEFELAKVTPGRGASGSGAGGVVFAPEPDPRKRWPYGDPHDPRYQEERAARLRWDRALERLHNQLVGGERSAGALDRQTGRTYLLESEFWLSNVAGKALKTFTTPRQGHYRPEGELVIKASRPELAPPPQRLSPRPSDKADLLAEARRRAASSEGPMTIEETIEWAGSRNLGRDWAREQRKAWPNELKRPVGNRRLGR